MTRIVTVGDMSQQLHEDRIQRTNGKRLDGRRRILHTSGSLRRREWSPVDDLVVMMKRVVEGL